MKVPDGLDKLDSLAKAHRVLVCGGREYGVLKERNFFSGAVELRPVKEVHREISYFKSVLDRVSDMAGPINLIIHGGARGADSLAGRWAIGELHDDGSVHTALMVFPADWKAYGAAAGGIRNAQMLAEGVPDLVVAFPGGAGTADMVRRARLSGVPVFEVPYPKDFK